MKRTLTTRFSTFFGNEEVSKYESESSGDEAAPLNRLGRRVSVATTKAARPPLKARLLACCVRGGADNDEDDEQDEDEEFESMLRKRAGKGSLVWSRPSCKGQGEARRGHTVALVGRDVVVFGGINQRGDRLSTMQVLSLGDMQWSETIRPSGNAPSARAYHTAVSLANDRMLVWGGKGADDALYVMDPATRAFETVKAGNAGPTARWGHAAAVLNNRMYICGGLLLRDGSVGELWELNCDTFLWTQHKLPTTQQGASNELLNPHPMLVAIPDSGVLILAGLWRNGNLRRVYKCQQRMMLWSSVTTTGIIPPARNFCTAITRNASVFIFGGVCTEPDDPGLSILSPVPESRRALQRRPQSSGKGALKDDEDADMDDSSEEDFAAQAKQERPTKGQVLNDCFVLDTTTMQWRPGNVLGQPPTPRTEVGSVIARDRVGATRWVVFGGYDGMKAVGEVRVVVSMSWTRKRREDARRVVLHELVPRIGHTMTAEGHRLFVIGGVSNGEPLNDVMAYDTRKDIWEVHKSSGDPPQGVIAHTTLAVDGELFVFGGGDGKNEANGLFIYDVENKQWSPVPTAGDMPGARYGHAAALHNNKMYVFGGYSVGMGYSETMHVLDIGSLEWTTPYISGKAPEARVGHSMNAVGDLLVIYGGSHVDSQFAGIFVLDLGSANLRWMVPQLANAPEVTPIGRYFHSAVTAGNCIVVFGGLVNVPKSTRADLRKIPRHWRQRGNRHVVDTMLLLDCERTSQPQAAQGQKPGRYDEGIGLKGWTRLKVDNISPGARFRHAVACSGTTMHLFGGLGAGVEMWSLEMGFGAGDVQRQVVQDTRIKTVAQWLTDIKADRYRRTFARAEIDWESLLELNDDDLKEMGVQTLGPRKRILDGIDKLRKLKARVVKHEDLFRRRYKIVRKMQLRLLSCVAVYEATDLTVAGRRVVLKLMDDRQSFLREVDMFARLRSEYVANMLDHHPADEDEEHHCIVFEYFEHSAQDTINSSHLLTNQRKSLIDRLARIVHHLHTHSVVHCDFKPDVVFLHQLQWRLCDLSTATMSSQRTRHTRASLPRFCSPELARAVLGGRLQDLKVLPAMDVWALGCILVETFLPHGNHFHRVAGGSMAALETLQTYHELALPGEEEMNEAQARHLAAKALRKNLNDRLPVTAFLRHAYLVGGNDTEQLQGAFDFLRSEQGRIEQQFAGISSRLQSGSKRPKAAKPTK